MKLHPNTEGILAGVAASLLALRMRVGAAGLGARVAGITLGERTAVRRGAVFDARGGSITIGDGAWIGPDVTILTGAADLLHGTKPARVGPVMIGAGASIGARAILLPGTRIGANAVVAVGAVVTTDVARGAIVAGTPARPVGRRRDDGSLEFTEPVAHATAPAIPPPRPHLERDPGSVGGHGAVRVRAP